MKAMRGLLTLIIVFLVALTAVNADITLKAAKINPIRLRLNGNTISSSKSFKTNPKLFQRLLRVKPGENFSMNLDGWHWLKRSGLFANLSAQANVVNDEVYLDITGDELTSVEFTPDITIKDMSNPSIITGVCQLTYII